ncbi:MAG: LysM peptidoglycan-binding domain-containing protein [Solirubrobacterales bacterium]|nr:LysM peptidoglycan-binding domain-containing protein [Solirubrobacterales bacterium]
MVGWRNPARYLAPLALAAAATATYLIVHHALEDKHASPAPAIVQTTSTHARSGGHANAAKAKFYLVQPNDTLSKIATRTGVSLSTLEALNPSINPDALHPTQRLRLRP